MNLVDLLRGWLNKPQIVSQKPPQIPGNTSSLGEVPWIAAARRYIGLTEVRGPKHHPKILEWWKLLNTSFTDDETSWCGGFIGGMLYESNYKSAIVKNPAGARNWLNSGVKLDKPAYGCIVVFWRGSRDGWQGHVGFVVGVDAKGNLMVLGGNQSDQVNIKPFSKDRVLGYRWPSKWPDERRFTLPILDSDGKVSTKED